MTALVIVLAVLLVAQGGADAVLAARFVARVRDQHAAHLATVHAARSADHVTIGELKRRVLELESQREMLRLDHRAETSELYRLAAAERHELWERIQRPGQEPVPSMSAVGAPRKLHHSEDDEIAGVSIDRVAQDAGLSPAHEHMIAHVDEIVRAEGGEPF